MQGIMYNVRVENLFTFIGDLEGNNLKMVMTNVSKNLLFAFAIVVSATVLSLGAFATTVLAADMGYEVDGGGWSDYGGYDSWSDYGGYDTWSDYGGYDSYTDYGGTDTWSDYGGYDSWSDYGGYDDYSDYGVGGYYDTNVGGYYDTNVGGYYDENVGGYYDENVGGYYDTNVGGYDYPSYTTGGGYSFGESFTTGGGYSFTPKFTTPGCTNCHPTYPTPGCTTNCYPTPKPTPGCTTCGGSNTNISTVTNTNTIIDNSITDNSFTDNSVHIVDNSINDSFNTTVIGDNNVVGGGYMGAAAAFTVVAPAPIAQVPAPYCVITLTNAGIYATQATLVWSSSNATAAYISSIGSVAPNGQRVVTGYANQIYSLTVTGQGGSYTCQTQMFTPSYVPPVQPINPSVSLTQIPYTGLDLGPIGNAMYWLSIFSVAAAGAYLAVYYKGGALALATAALTTRRNVVVSEEEVEAAEVTENVSTPVANTFGMLPAFAMAQTRDSMVVARNADGMPRIVISRA
jgi:hypothetical protein